MIWYLADMSRYKREQDAVRELEREVGWLVAIGWGIDSSLRLFFRFELTIGTESIPFTLRYGQGFPSGPPSVFPDPPRRLSSHQYGDGDLCTEYGPDTWVRELTGADLIRSAYRLLSGEVIAAVDPLQSVPSRHELTKGQAARNERTRFMLTTAVQEFLAGAPRGLVRDARFRFQYNGVSGVFLLVSVAGVNGDGWSDPELPQAITRPSYLDNGVVIGVGSGVHLPTLSDRAEVDAFLVAHGLTTPSDEVDILLLHSDEELRLLWFSKDGNVLPVATLPATSGQRLDPAHTALAAKRVAIVGCGSIGSKLAVILARAGVVDFVLVDDDIFFPENLVRNDLAWTEVGQHKADAVAQRVQLVSPRAKCVVRKQRVGGQESNSVADSTIHLLQDCDLIIDASAEPTVFNVLSDAATAASKMMVWTEVFAGGIGGLIARFRPALDPSPQTMRAGINAWCAERGVRAPRPIHGYGAEETSGDTSWIADDAEVTIVTGNAARFAIDLLLDRSPSWYPFSVYLIGLSPSWLFDQPFVTFPIDFSSVPVASSRPPVDNDPETLAAILKLVTERNAQPATPS